MSFRDPASTNHRPWYVLDGAVDEHRAALREGGDLRMLKTLKLLKSIVVIVTIGAVSLYGLYLGADPTIISSIALAGLIGYGTFEGIDYGALLQAYREAQQEDDEDDENEEDN